MTRKLVAAMLAVMMVAASAAVFLPMYGDDDADTEGFAAGQVSGESLKDLAAQGWTVVDDANFMKVMGNIGSAEYPIDGKYILSESVDISDEPRLDGTFQINVTATADGGGAVVSLSDPKSGEPLTLENGIISANGSVRKIDGTGDAVASVRTGDEYQILVMAGGIISSPSALSGKEFAFQTIVSIGDGAVEVYSDGRYAPACQDIPFAGIFDGNGYDIAGIDTRSFSSDGDAASGLFARTDGASVRNLNIHGEQLAVSSASDVYAGGMIGSVRGAMSVTGCWNGCTIYALSASHAYAGGIAGTVDGLDGTVRFADIGLSGIINVVSVGVSSAGGIVGDIASKNVILERCNNSSAVRAWASDAIYAGGFAGSVESEKTTLSGCSYYLSRVSGTLSGQDGISNVSGIANCLSGGSVDVRDCQNYGTITSYGGAFTSASGIIGPVGTGADGTISAYGCSNMGNVSAVGLQEGGVAYAGGIVSVSMGNNQNFEICNNYWTTVSASAEEAYAGGIIGYSASGANLSVCWNEGNVTSASSRLGSTAGGIAGMLCGTMTAVGCSNTGDVTSSSDSGVSSAGGVIGRMYGSGTVSQSRNVFWDERDVSSHSASSDAYAGGIVGYAEGNGSGTQIEDCFNRLPVSATTDSGTAASGGIAGRSVSANVLRCYSTGIVTAGTSSGSVAGGIVGSSDSVGISFSYFETTDDAAAISNGTFTVTPSGDSGIRSSDELRTRDSADFEQWDFKDIWGWDDAINDGYPIMGAVLAVHVGNGYGYEGDTIMFDDKTSISITDLGIEWQVSYDGTSWTSYGDRNQLVITLDQRDVMVKCIVTWGPFTAECIAAANVVVDVTAASEMDGTVGFTYSTGGNTYENVPYRAGDVFQVDRSTDVQCDHIGEDVGSLYWTTVRNGGTVAVESETFSFTASVKTTVSVAVADCLVDTPDDGTVDSEFIVGKSTFERTGEFYVPAGTEVSFGYKGDDMAYWTVRSSSDEHIKAGGLVRKVTENIEISYVIGDVHISLGKGLDASYNIDGQPLNPGSDFNVVKNTYVKYSYAGSDDIAYWTVNSRPMYVSGDVTYLRSQTNALIDTVAGDVMVTMKYPVTASYPIDFDGGRVVLSISDNKFFVVHEAVVTFENYSYDGIAYWTFTHGMDTENIKATDFTRKLMDNTDVGYTKGDVAVTMGDGITASYDIDGRRFDPGPGKFYAVSGTDVAFKYGGDAAYWTFNGVPELPGEMVKRIETATDVSAVKVGATVTVGEDVSSTFEIGSGGNTKVISLTDRTFKTAAGTSVTFSYGGNDMSYWTFAGPDGTENVKPGDLTRNVTGDVDVSYTVGDILVTLEGEIEASYDIGSVRFDPGDVFRVASGTDVMFDYIGQGGLAYIEYTHGNEKGHEMDGFTKKITQDTRISAVIGDVQITVGAGAKASYAVGNDIIDGEGDFYVVSGTDVTFSPSGGRAGFWTYMHDGVIEKIAEQSFHRTLTKKTFVSMYAADTEVVMPSDGSVRASYSLNFQPLESAGTFYVTPGTEVTFRYVGDGHLAYWTLIQGAAEDNIEAGDLTRKIAEDSEVLFVLGTLRVTADANIASSYEVDGDTIAPGNDFHVAPGTEVTFAYDGNAAYWKFNSVPEYHAGDAVREIMEDTRVSVSEGTFRVGTDDGVTSSYTAGGWGSEVTFNITDSEFFVIPGTEVTFAYDGDVAYWTFTRGKDVSYISGSRFSENITSHSTVSVAAGDVQVTVDPMIDASYSVGNDIISETGSFFVVSGTAVTFTARDSDVGPWRFDHGGDLEYIDGDTFTRTITKTTEVGRPAASVKVMLPSDGTVKATYELDGTVYSETETFLVAPDTEVTFRYIGDGNMAYWTFVQGESVEFINAGDLTRRMTEDSDVSYTLGDVDITVIAGNNTINWTYGGLSSSIGAGDTSVISIPSGTEVTFTALPETGMGFLYWIYSGMTDGDNPFAGSFTENTTVEAISVNEADLCSVTIGGMDGGIVEWRYGSVPVTGTGSFRVPAGTEVTFTAIPDPGFEFTGWSTGGDDHPMTLTVTGDITVHAEFIRMQFAIIASADDNGRIDPSGTVLVDAGGSVTFTFNAADGFTVVKVMVDGDNVDVKDSYTFSDVMDDHTIEIVTGVAPVPPPSGLDVGLLEILVIVTAIEALAAALAVRFVREKRSKRKDRE